MCHTCPLEGGVDQRRQPLTLGLNIFIPFRAKTEFDLEINPISTINITHHYQCLIVAKRSNIDYDDDKNDNYKTSKKIIQICYTFKNMMSQSPCTSLPTVEKQKQSKISFGVIVLRLDYTS